MKQDGRNVSPPEDSQQDQDLEKSGSFISTKRNQSGMANHLAVPYTTTETTREGISRRLYQQEEQLSSSLLLLTAASKGNLMGQSTVTRSRLCSLSHDLDEGKIDLLSSRRNNRSSRNMIKKGMGVPRFLVLAAEQKSCVTEAR
ncbi:unnamed protein product [Amoebophrya sp. A25]|nr:unnamed protein product [Amoebophrya sp. A25]|eukprot:GSA25T00005908001.1